MTHRRFHDIEEGLSRLVGDVAAHQIGRVLRGAAGWGRHAGETLVANISEYLREESRDLIARPELENFSAGVNEVSGRVDALAARIQLLKAQPRE